MFAMTDAVEGSSRDQRVRRRNLDTPGWAVTRVEDKMGIHGAHSAQLSFSRHARAARQICCSRKGEGFKVAMKTLDGGRIGIASQAIGIARASLEASLKYAQERLTFGKPIAQYQAIQWKLADMAVEIDAARLLTHRAATLKDRRPALHQANPRWRSCSPPRPR